MIYTPGCTVVIPSIPPRTKLLSRALASVAAQTEPACAVAIAYDDQKQGAGPTRNRALKMVTTEWTAFLDDDDEMLPNHIELLAKAAKEQEAAVVWPWFEVVGGTDPFPGHRGHQLNPEQPNIFPITTLVRTEYAHLATFTEETITGDWAKDDWPFWRTIYEAGGKFLHIPDITWRWHHHGWGKPGQPGNTSGRQDRW
jgi:glycosyltransferase involved in cell wall biosynthesis